MRKIAQLLLVGALLGVPATLAPVASAQTTPGYYDVPQPAAEVASDARTSAKSSLAKVSYSALLKGAKQISFEVGGRGTYEFKLTAKVKGKTVVLASGKRTVNSTATTKATTKIKLTAAGKKYFRSLKAKTAKLKLEASFKPRGAKKTTKSSTSLNLKRK